MIGVYIIIAALLLIIELVYFKIADKYSIIDKPNERSSHSSTVLRGGGIIFTIAIIVWFVWQLLANQYFIFQDYLPFVLGLVLIAGVSFWDDVHSLPDSVRLLAQFTSMGLLFWSIGIMHWNMWWIVLIALIVSVGATNIYNFMDGINGITAGYSLVVLFSLLLLNQRLSYIDNSFLIVSIIGVLVFCIFNFRPKGKAKCFAGDVGSVGIAFILMFLIGCLIMKTRDITWLIFLLVYGVDGCCTIVHRIILHEHLGEAHRKHAYQLMANELKMSHVVVSLIYMALQLLISLGFVYLCPNTMLAHWIYLISAGIALVVAYVVFMKKYYHLHAEYLESLKK